jgi:hypothetical protein
LIAAAGSKYDVTKGVCPPVPAERKPASAPTLAQNEFSSVLNSITDVRYHILVAGDRCNEADRINHVDQDPGHERADDLNEDKQSKIMALLSILALSAARMQTLPVTSDMCMYTAVS